MFDNTQSNSNSGHLNLDDLNKNKNYPFKPVDSEKKLSGLKGPIEDILADSETDLPTGQLPADQNKNNSLNLKEMSAVPSMAERVAKDNYDQTNNNNIVAGAPLASRPTKGKFFIILIIALIILIFGIAAVFAYNYLVKNKSASPTLAPNESLQKLLETLNEEQKNDNEVQNNNTPAQESPILTDSDSDGLSAERELELGTNPSSSDTDNDGLSDSEEINIYETNPILKDTDSDDYDDGAEVKNGYDPALPGNAKLIK